MPHKKTKRTSTPPAKTRQLAPKSYRRFRLEKRIRHPGTAIPSATKILNISLRHIWKYKKVFLGITAIYLLLTILFVRGYVFTNDLAGAKEAIEELVTGTSGQLAGSLTVLGILIGSSVSSNQASVLYQIIIGIIVSLAIIWSLRQSYSNKPVGMKDAFYNSTYPLIPFVFILGLIGIQLLPLAIGNFLYSAATNAGLTASFIENFAWLGLMFILSVWSLYMITATLFALYIVTLPDMMPLRAWRSGRELARYRRWTVMRKLLFFPFIILFAGILIIIPVIMIYTPAAELVYIALSAASLVLFHSYVYALYRELL